MVFSSLVFLFVFLPVVLAVYFIIPKRFRNAFLFAADFVFYGWGEPILVVLMVVSVLVNWACGLALERFNAKQAVRKALFIASVVFDLGLLGFFKYAGFISETLRYILPHSGIKVLEIPLPVGISFYTFQILSYTIDVYRGNADVQHSFLKFGTYISLFPQLIAGPIVRYTDIEHQLDERTVDFSRFSRGVKLFAVGLGKKVLLANSVGSLWDTLRDTRDIGSFAKVIGLVAYSFQIYFDFCGYSDMARGLGEMFGFTFLKNFDYPYISRSITEFWRRWHISLGTWFREYVYIPLGGNRKGKTRTVINLLVVWLLTGIWHGAGINFILWGLYFGIILIVEKLFLYDALQKAPKAVGHIYSIILIVFGWCLFYFSSDAGGFTAMSIFIKSLFNGPFITHDGVSLLISGLSILLLCTFFSTPLTKKIYNKIQSHKISGWIDGAAVISLLILSTASLAGAEYNPFLYFRF